MCVSFGALRCSAAILLLTTAVACISRSDDVADDSDSCGCISGHVDWGMDGGRILYQETSALEVCNLFVHQRLPVAADPPALFCEQQFSNCADAMGPRDVTRAIAHADVQAAIAAAPVFYGEDARAYDGQVLRIRIESAMVEVGVPCQNTICKPIPAGVDALARLLLALTNQELRRAPCSTTFPPLS